MPATARSALAPIQMTVPASDGLILRGTLTYPPARTGAPFPLAVLAHQYPAARGSWAPLEADLQAMGIATLAFDMRGQGESIWGPTGVRAAPMPAEPTMEAFGAAFMASAGALGFSFIADDIVRVASWGMAQNHIDPARLYLGGASVGGTGVLLAAPRLAVPLKAVLTFGAAGAGVHASDAMERIRAACESLTLPMFLTTSEADPFDGANNARTWSAGLSHVSTKIVKGDAHAMAIYFDVRPDVLAFVRAAAGRGRAKASARRARGRRGGGQRA